jgi:hypothetical protein
MGVLMFVIPFLWSMDPFFRRKKSEVKVEPMFEINLVTVANGKPESVYWPRPWDNSFQTPSSEEPVRIFSASAKTLVHCGMQIGGEAEMATNTRKWNLKF